MSPVSTIRLVEHLARVEGHGGITVEMEDDAIRHVRFDVLEGPRLLEALLRGRHHTQVATTISRICAICSAAHLVSSLRATEAAFGTEITPRTRLLRELQFRGESIESHALHVFLLALPDYFGAPSAPALAAEQPEAVKLGLRLKQLGNTIQEVIGGRAIHPVNFVLGGMAHQPDLGALARLRDALTRAMDDMRTTVDIVAALPPDDFMDAETTFAAIDMRQEYGYYDAGDQMVVMTPRGRRRIPIADYRTLTSERSVDYSYAKLSEVEGEPFMVGALARITVNRRRLTLSGADAMARLGLVLPSGNPLDNTRAQVVELVMDVERSLEIVERLLAEGPVDERPVPIVPRAGVGVAVTEAPRGLLVHEYEYDDAGMVVHADVITPTAMNAASIERHFHETVAQSPTKDDATLARKLELVARAYDPCISCSVHVVRRGCAAP
jgi:sulfhydrogenase subunit alpha